MQTRHEMHRIHSEDEIYRREIWYMPKATHAYKKKITPWFCAHIYGYSAFQMNR